MTNSIHRLPRPTPGPLPLNRAQILMGMALTALVLLVLAKLWQWLAGVPLLPWQLSWGAIGLGMAMGITITTVSLGLYQFSSVYRSSAEGYLALVLRPLALQDLIWLGLLPGLSEELLFRGVMLPSLGLNWLGLLVSSAAFGVMHMSNRQQWPYAIWATVVGGILGGSAIISGNLLIPVVTHITTNLLSGLLWKLMIRQPEHS